MLIIFAKRSALYVWQGPEYVFIALNIKVLKVHSRRFENLPICSCSHKINNLEILHS